MTQTQHITSTANGQVKDLVRVQQQASERRATGRFCIESPRELHRALQAGFIVEQLWVAGERDGARQALEDVGGQARQIVQTSPAVIGKISYRENPSGFVAVVAERRTELADLRVSDKPLIVVCSGLEKPGNVGAILRSADCAGADAVLLDDPQADLFNPNCVRASTGAVFGMPVARAEASALRAWLSERGVVVIAATPEAELTYLHANLSGPIALVLGAEAEGLSDYWRQAADLQMAVRMNCRAADSLNVSVTAGVLLFEAQRQRT